MSYDSLSFEEVYVVLLYPYHGNNIVGVYRDFDEAHRVSNEIPSSTVIETILM
jgi:hypothetical protein